MPEMTRPSEFRFATDRARARAVIQTNGVRDFGVHMPISARQSAERRRSAVSVVRGPRDVQRVLELTAAGSALRLVSSGADR
jgi:hypothetical protein